MPPGYTAEQRGVPGGFVGDPDVMDTWATSSLHAADRRAAGRTTPTCSSALFPMDLRPQAHDIIRTWLFYTVLRAHLEHDSLPWTNAAISGFVLDPDRKKMSKSKGNVVVPTEVFEQHSADAVRYWAASARLGYDAAIDEQQMKVGPPPRDQDPQRLAVRALDGSRPGRDHRAARPLDARARSPGSSSDATAAFDAYEHAKALDVDRDGSSGASPTTTSSS